MSAYGSAYASSAEEPEYGDKAVDGEVENEEKRDPRASNFPWFCLPKLRCFYHNISKEVRDGVTRGAVYREHILWYVAFAAYVTNLVGESYRYSKRSALSASYTYVDLGISIALLILLYPFTLLVYFLLYGAARNVGKSWTWWWLLGGAQIATELFFAIGIPKTGAAGLVVMIQAFQKKQNGLGFALLAAFLFWFFLCLVHLIDYIILWRRRTAIEGGYATQSNETSYKGEQDADSPEETKSIFAKKDAKKKKKKEKKDKKTAPPPAPEPSNDSSYQPPAPTTASSGSAYEKSASAYEKSGSAYEHSAAESQPAWQGSSGSAYESAYDRPSSKSSSSATSAPTGSNPFGDDGNLDDFYH